MVISATTMDTNDANPLLSACEELPSGVGVEGDDGDGDGGVLASVQFSGGACASHERSC